MTGWQVQGARYAVVGLLSNVALYLVYLGLTAVGVGHKTAMTLSYVAGTLQTFLFNRAWTFQHTGAVPRSLGRYLAAYLGSYVLNLGVLYLFVDRLGLPHAVVQGVAILGIAVLLFVVQRSWVFPAARHREARLAERI